MIVRAGTDGALNSLALDVELVKLSSDVSVVDGRFAVCARSTDGDSLPCTSSVCIKEQEVRISLDREGLLLLLVLLLCRFLLVGVRGWLFVL